MLNFTAVFLAYISGLLSITVAIALYITGGKTIFVLSIPCLLYLFYSMYRSKKTWKIAWNYPPNQVILVCLGFVSVAFLYKSLPFVQFSEGVFKTPHSDYLIYSIIANTMAKTGQENTYAAANLLIPGLSGASPYHYAEIWLSIGVTNILPLNNFNSLIFIVYPSLLFGWMLALLAFWEVHARIPVQRIWLVFFLVFISGVHLNIFYKIDFLSLTGVYGRNLVTELGEKYGYVYLLFALSLLFWHYWGMMEASIVLLLIPITFAVAVPGVLGAFPFILIIWRKRFRSSTPFIPALGIYIALLLGVLLFSRGQAGTIK